MEFQVFFFLLWDITVNTAKHVLIDVCVRFFTVPVYLLDIVSPVNAQIFNSQVAYLWEFLADSYAL